jgi:hypothetical protein
MKRRTLAVAVVPPARRKASTARRSGKTAESVLVAWLKGQGAPYAERRIAGARLDTGDVAGIPGVCIEVKCPGPDAPMRLAGWLDETLAERDNGNAELGILAVKRRGRGSPGQWYWITDGDTMARLLRDAGWMRAPGPTR